MPITTVIFDMDGLMVDSETQSFEAWNRFLRPFNHQLTEAQNHKMIGLRAEVSSEYVRSLFDLPLSVPEIIAQKAAIFNQLRANGVPAMPGLFDLLDALDARRLAWGVATSSPRHHALEVLNQHNLAAQCQALTAGDEVAHGKPAPDIYLLAAQRLNAAPQNCLALEDSGPGSQAAVAAGMRTIAVPNRQTAVSNFDHVYRVMGSLTAVCQQLDALLA